MKDFTWRFTPTRSHWLLLHLRHYPSLGRRQSELRSWAWSPRESQSQQWHLLGVNWNNWAGEDFIYWREYFSPLKDFNVPLKCTWWVQSKLWEELSLVKPHTVLLSLPLLEPGGYEINQDTGDTFKIFTSLTKPVVQVSVPRAFNVWCWPVKIHVKI